ncbi:hypothetical protein BKI52_02290 [marine bacterium AO1-C]|nr:hypothetical protein BKI52_02290 [marine bacterium AO1-C]
MKKTTFLFTLLGLGWLVACNHQLQQKFSEAPRNPSIKKLSKYDRMDLAWQQEYHLTRDPQLNLIPKDRLELGKTMIKKQLLDKQRLRTQAANITWRERGPGNVGGRTRAILVDPNDATSKTVFSAGVSGGLWKTTDITVKSPVWTKVDDFFDNLAIVTLAYDPTDTKTIYFGTGEGWSNFDAVRGGGIWKTTDGGVSWSRTSFGSSNFVQKIVINSSGEVFAGTRSGLFKSTDKGGTWNKLSGLPQDRISDVEIGSNNVIHVGMGIFNNGYYRYSSDGGTTWNTPTGFPANSDIQRVELAVAPGNPNQVYAMMQGSGNGFFAGFRSTDGGANWTEMAAKPNDLDTQISASDFTRSQAWYNLALAVDPNNANTIITGGIDLFKSTDGGDTWSQISKWSGNNLLGTLSVPLVHADHHTVTYIDSKKILFGNDGGIYYSEDGDQSVPTITSKEEGYNTSQFYSCAIHPTAGENFFLGGTQDNGSHKITDKLIGNSVEVTGGDGGFAHIDQNEPQYQFTAFTRNNWFTSTDGGVTFTQINHSFANAGSFINPTDYDNDANLLYAGSSAGAYVRWNDPQSGNKIANVTQFSVPEFSSAQVTHVSVTPNTANRVFFGLDNGAVVRIDNANTASPTATQINSSSAMPTNASVSCITVEKGNDNHILVTYSNYGVGSVWETSDGGTTWFNVEGNLPDMPVRWTLFNPNNNKQALIATELGVWFTEEIKGVNTIWSAANAGLANVRVDMLQIRETDNTIIAATHGRGIFSTNFFAATPTADFVVSKKLVYSGANVQFTDISSKAESWSWEFGDGATSTLQNPTHAYSTPGIYNVKLTINGSNSATINNAVQVLPSYGTPYTLTQGGNFETNPNDFGSEAIEGTINPWERGTPTNLLKTLSSSSNGWKTDLDANIVQGDYKAVLQTPAFNFSASGTYTVKFKMSMDILYCDGPYGMFMEYSLDNGVNWQVLGAANNNPSGTSNWYQTGPSKAGQSCGVNAVTDSQKSWGFDGNNVSVQYNATALAGNSNVAFRFVYQVASGFSSDGYDIDGVMIDDFEITGPTNEASHFAVINASGATSFCDGEQVIFTANSGDGFTYQWQKNGVDIAGATNASYSANAAGEYRVVVTKNSVGVNSNTIQVTVKANPLPIIQVNGGVLSINAETGATYQWTKDGANISGATETSFTPTECGSYAVKASYPNACQRTSAIYDFNNINLSVSVTANGNTLTASVTDATLYTWFLNDNVISGATTSTYEATEAGIYKVRVVKDGCPASSDGLSFTPTGVDETLSNRLQLFPNPVNDVLRLAFDHKLGQAKLQIVNTQGQVVQQLSKLSNGSKFSTDLNVSRLPAGTYILQIILEDGRSAVKRFYKQ